MSNSKRNTFKDQDLQEAFSANGYVVIQLAEAEEMKRMAEAYLQLYPYEQEGCVFSYCDIDLE